MATKKKAAAGGTPSPAAPVDVPAVLVSDDGNKYLGRAKAALAKKWSLTRVESLADASDIAWFLLALGRADEARELADHVSERAGAVSDPAAWLPVSLAMALGARLARLAGDEPRRAALVARMAARPAVPAQPPAALVKAIAEADKDVRSAEVDPSQKWACQGFARGCARASYFRELAAGGPYADGALDVEALERTISEGLAGLRAHLAR